MSETSLLAGVGRVNVTPPIGIQLFGYHRKSPMTDVHDPLFMTALALVDATGASDPLVLLAIDHIGMGRRESLALRSAAAVAAGTSVGRVAACFSHTHSGPDTERRDWHGRERPPDALERVYGATLPAQAASATRLAMQRLRPARAGHGMAVSEAGVNRRIRGPTGRAEQRVNPAGLVDRDVVALRIDAEDGRPIASVVHYGIHGTVFKSDNLACSADAAGAVRDTVEAATGAPCLFVQGAAGDVNPRWRGDEAALRRTGWELGGAALRAVANAEPRPFAALACASETVPLHLVPLPDEDAAIGLAREVARLWEAPTDGWLELVRRKLAAGERRLTREIEIQAIRVNDFVRVGIPLEPFAGLSLAFRERISQHEALERPGYFAFGGYTNGVFGYLPTAEEHAAGGYEVEWMPVVYGSYEEDGLLMPPVQEAGDDIVNAAIDLARRLCSMI